jgi:hypothetical protein
MNRSLYPKIKTKSNLKGLMSENIHHQKQHIIHIDAQTREGRMKYFSKHSITTVVASLLSLISITFAQERSKDTSNSRLDSSYFIIAGIKSIAGETPSREFFDMTIKFNYSSLLFTFATLDVAFTDTSADDAEAKLENLSEAGVSINFDLQRLLFAKNDRHVFIGSQMKIFDNDLYWGFHIGSFESNGMLFGSYLTIGYLRRVYNIDAAENAALEKHEHEDNLYFEFALHSETLPVIKNLRLKGGVLIPMPNNRNPRPVASDMKTRIVIEVPVGGLVKF